jgi:hypothetical protein
MKPARIPEHKELVFMWTQMLDRVRHQEECKDPSCKHDDDPPSYWETATVRECVRFSPWGDETLISGIAIGFPQGMGLPREHYIKEMGEAVVKICGRNGADLALIPAYSVPVFPDCGKTFVPLGVSPLRAGDIERWEIPPPIQTVRFTTADGSEWLVPRSHLR